MVVYQSNQDVEQPMQDLYMGDEHSTVTSLGPSPDELEAVYNRTEIKRMRNNKILFGLGAFIILMASIPILLFGLDKINISSSSSVAIMNDVCLEAVVLDSTGDSYAATTAGAKHDEDSDFENCGVDVGIGIGPGVWFSVIGSGGPIKVIKNEENAFTNQISVYQGHCGELKCVTGDNLKGTVLWNAQKDQTYYIRVSGVNEAVGNFNIVLQDLSDERKPEELVMNDNCQTSIGLSTDGSNSLGTTETAMFDLEGAGSCYRTMHAGRGIWFDAIGTGESLVASTNTSEIQLAIFKGSCDNLECVTASDLADGVATYVQWHSALAERYFILAHSVGGGKGSPFEISIGNDNPGDNNFVINDFCKGAIGPVASDGSVQRGSTTFATLDRDGAGSCYPDTLSGDGVWFSVEGTGDSLKVYPSMDSGIEPLVSVFEGSCRKLECVDGTRHDIDDEERKVVKWRTSEDSTYYLLVRGVDTKGSFEIIIESFEEEAEETAEPAPTGSPTITAAQQEIPANDFCDTAAEIPALGFALIGSTENAAPYLDSIGECNSEPNEGPGVWYRIAGDGKPLNAHTAATSELDAFITVYAGDCEALVCVPDVNGDLRTKRSYSWDTTTGVVYYILVQGHAEDEKGQFEIVVEEIAPIPGTGPTVAPGTVVNDHCDGALGPIPANGTVVTGSNEGATIDMDGVGSCYEANATGVGVWYTVIGTGETLEILSKGITGLEFSVTLFDGFDCGTLSCVKSDYVPANKAGVLAWDSIRNVPYYVLVHGVDTAEGSFELMVVPTRSEGTAPGSSEEQETGGSIEIEIITENDACVRAIGPLSSSDKETIASTTQTASAAWEHAEEGACSTPGSAGVWYSIEGSGNVVKASIENVSGGNAPDISIFSGSCDFISCVDSTSNRSPKSVSWYAASDQLYYVVAHSPIESTAAFELTLEPVETPVNNDCDASLPALVPGDAVVMGTTEGATVDTNVGNCHEEANSPGVWYRLVGTGNTMTLVQNNTHDHETMISVFSGGCDDLLCRNGFNSLLPQRGPVSWTTEEGEDYFLHFHSHSGTGGQFEFNLQEQESPATEVPAPTEANPNNDICQDAIGPLPAGSRSDGQFGTATADAVGMCGTATNADPGVWFTVEGTGAGIRISTCKSFVAGFHEVSASPVSVSVFRQGCDDLQCHVGSNDTCSAGGVVNWNTEKDELYHILITGDEAARKEDYVLLQDHTQWLVRNCVGESEEFIEQLHALKHLYDATGNTRQSGPLLEKGWLSGCDVCNKWSGLECNNNEEVTKIRLGGQTPALSGTIPSAVHHGFKQLAELELSDNDLTGTIPDLSGVDRTLQSLNLKGNNLTGSLPEKFTQLDNLVFLNLNSNQLSGELPDEISEMKSLRLMAVANNTLGGTIPVGLSSLNELEDLQLHSNGFSSTIPSELGLLTNLHTLEMHGNQLQGTMPAEICELRRIGALTSLTADCEGVEPAVYCSSDCCTACR